MAELPKLTEISVDQFNADLRRISRQMADAVKSEARARSVGDSESATGDGLRSIKGFTKKTQGEVERLGIKFQRHLIFVEHGVGRGRSVDDAPGETSGRRPRPFLSAGVDKYQEQVADLAARYHADNAVQIIDQQLEQLDHRSTSIRITKS